MRLKGDYNFWFNVGASLIILAVMISPCLQKIFSARPIVYLGEISLGIYLLHEPIEGTFGSWSYYTIHSLCGSTVVSFIATLFLCAAVIVIAAALFQKYIAANILKLINTIYEKIVIMPE